MRKKKGNRGARKRQSKKTRLILAALGLLVVILFATVSNLFFFPRASKNADICIPKGATTAMIGDTIAKYLGDGYSSRVMRCVGLLGTDMASRSGLYEIKQGTAPWRAAWHLCRGGQKSVKLVLNNLRTRADILAFISSRMSCSATSIDSLLNDEAFMAQYSLTPATADALFLNDTFEFYWNASAKDILTKIGKNYNNFWSEERREKASALELSPVEVMILASIVEEESNLKSEYGLIGRLYLNRLHKGMRLQADPTVKFALGDFSIKRVTNEMLSIQSPYNTYRNAGLPPGPIRTVSATTVDAILNSSPTTDLYMCAKPDFSGGHDFTSSYQEHLRNAARYREALNRNNIH